MFLADRQTDIINHFSQFCESSYKVIQVFSRVTSKFSGSVKRKIEINKGQTAFIESFEGVYYTHKQDRLTELSAGITRYQIYGMGFLTCGSSIELFLWESREEWEIKTSRFEEGEKKRRCKRKRCRVRERDGEIAVRQELPLCQQRSAPETHTCTHTYRKGEVMSSV